MPRRKRAPTTQRQRTPSSIPDEVKGCVLATVDRFNQQELAPGECFYVVRFQGRYCYLDRVDYGSKGPICRLGYRDDPDKWEFAIFRWSSERYDPDERMFPGAQFVDGTVIGAMRAGMEAYPA
jgi:hypothetical protein